MTTPNLDAAALSPIDHAALGNSDPAPVKIALLYGSLRARSYSRLLSEEAVRILEALGAECRLFNPTGLPLPDDGADAGVFLLQPGCRCDGRAGQIHLSDQRADRLSGR